MIFKDTVSFCVSSCFLKFLATGTTYSSDYLITEAEAEAISVAGVVVVGVAIAVDITEVVGVARIRRDLPPVVRTASATT